MWEFVKSAAVIVDSARHCSDLALVIHSVGSWADFSQFLEVLE
jgi:hypothetical protein